MSRGQDIAEVLGPPRGGVRHQQSGGTLSLHRLLDIPIEARAPHKPLAPRPALSNEPKLSPFS